MDGLLTIASFLSDMRGGGWVELLLPAGLVLITIGVLASLRARRRRAGDRLGAREQLERFRQQKGVREDLETLMVEIEQLAKRMGAQLDAKAMHLESLLKQSQSHIDQLRKLQRLDTQPPPPGPHAASMRENAQPDSDGSAQDASLSVTDHDNAPAGDPLSRKVGQLADQGLSPLDIARRLDEHTGKIELILALRSSGGKS